MLREQTVTSRAGREVRTKARARDFEQRPRRRARERREQKHPVRVAFTWLAARWRLVGKLALVVIVGVALFAGYRAAESASFFQVKEIEVAGATRANANEIRAIVKRMVAPVGVWRADLEAISTAIKKQQTWVKDAVVSRVLPSGVRVRVTERTPEAVIRTGAGRLVWIDSDGVMLGAATNFGANSSSLYPPMPPVLIRGWDETETDEARAENLERLAAYHSMLDAWRKEGIVDRVSEVNLQDLLDVRAQLAGDDGQVEVRLGKERFGERLERALKVLSDMKASGRYAPGAVAYLNAAQTGRIIVGFNPGAQNPSDENLNSSADAPKPTAKNESGNNERAEATRASSAAAMKKRSEVDKSPSMSNAKTTQRNIGAPESVPMTNGTKNENQNTNGADRPRRVARETQR